MFRVVVFFFFFFFLVVGGSFATVGCSVLFFGWVCLGFFLFLGLVFACFFSFFVPVLGWLGGVVVFLRDLHFSFFFFFL